MLQCNPCTVFLHLKQKIGRLKKLLFVIFLTASLFAKAQKVESIYVNLYTDSLKKGTYNYINVDGLLSNGRYAPLDSSTIIFSSSEGKFFGNSLWIEKDFKKEKIDIKVALRNNPSVFKSFTMYIKTKEDNERLKTADEIMNEINTNSKTKKKKN